MSARSMCKRLAVLAAITLAGCNFGQRPNDFPTAVAPAGARVIVSIRGESAERNGELYAVDTTGILLRGERLLRVPWQRLASMNIPSLSSDYDIVPGEIVSTAKRERLALVSRFPQGLRSPLLERVLALIPQASVDSLR